MPAQPLAVAAAVPLSLAGDVAGNAIRHADLSRAAAARVVAFPELSLTGFHLDAEAVSPDDPRLSPIVEACAATGSTALVGAPAGTDGSRQIAMFAVDGAGSAVAYRNRALGGREPEHVVAGRSPGVLVVDGWRLGLGICKGTGASADLAETAALGCCRPASPIRPATTRERRDGPASGPPPARCSPKRGPGPGRVYGRRCAEALRRLCWAAVARRWRCADLGRCGARNCRSGNIVRHRPGKQYIRHGCASITYMSAIPVADARAQLSRLIDSATATHERFEITRNGRRAAVLLSADDYDTLQDTIAVLSDAELLAAHHRGRAAIDAGDYVDADQLAYAMREAGRLPQ